MRTLILLLWTGLVFGQGSPLDSISGRVITYEGHVTIGLAYATVQWMDGAATIADERGFFALPMTTAQDRRIIASFIGHVTDTVLYKQQENWTITLESNNLLTEATVAYRKRGTAISSINPIKTEMMGVKELRKAACCNLSESFETNPSVDVSFADAVTGTKQIKMLGLAGRYSLITRESMPVMHGYAAVYGMSFVPGTWVDGIQISKGTGTVANGFESMSGQINIELLKPENKPPVLLNLFANQGGRMEANMHLQKNLSEKLSSALLLHGNMRGQDNDRNQDGFLDMPTGQQINALNRWKWNGDQVKSQFGVHLVHDEKNGGQFSGNETDYTVGLTTQKADIWSKIAYLSPHKTYQSIGLQLAGLYFHQKGQYGHRDFDATQKSYYANLIFESIIGSTEHKYRLGGSLMGDDIVEQLDTVHAIQERHMPGLFLEYTWTPSEKFTVITGLRSDWWKAQSFLSPRLHLRYAPQESLILRLSGGRGMRFPLLLGDRSGLAATSRQWLVEPASMDVPEIAWNVGLNLTKNFKWDFREGHFSFDFYRTDFTQKLVTDLETPGIVSLYPLSGKSFSNSFQAEWGYELIKRMDVRLAYRYFDVMTTFRDKGLQRDPFAAQHRSFMNIGYETRKRDNGVGWAFDVTTQWIGSQRIPGTESNPPAYQRPNESPSYFQLHSQVTAKIGKRLEIYLGGENLLDYRQDQPIIGADEPFGSYFDSAQIWGPIFGRTMYVGLRW